MTAVIKAILIDPITRKGRYGSVKNKGKSINGARAAELNPRNWAIPKPKVLYLVV